jgi:hypothetical protein
LPFGMRCPRFLLVCEYWNALPFVECVAKKTPLLKIQRPLI